MVASRWTWVPSSRDKAAVSASHSCGKRSATVCTGQWCWQSWVPGRVPGAGEGEELGGAPAAAPRRDRALLGRDGAGGQHRVEVSADGGGGQAEPLGQRRCRGRTQLEEQAGDALPRAAVGSSEVRGLPRRNELRGFHNASVP